MVGLGIGIHPGVADGYYHADCAEGVENPSDVKALLQRDLKDLIEQTYRSQRKQNGGEEQQHGLPSFRPAGGGVAADKDKEVSW